MKLYQLKTAGTALVLVLCGALAIGAFAMSASAVSVGDSPYNVTLDDPDAESIDVALDFAASTDATVELTDGTKVFDSTTISGNASETKVASLSTGAAEAGETYDLTIDSPSAADVTVNETTVVVKRSVTVEDAGNETLVVDASFTGDLNATADVTVTDGTGNVVLTDTIEYVAANHSDDPALLTREYNDTDGLLEMSDGTVMIETSPASAYDAAYASVDSESSSLLGGTIAGQDTTVAIVGVALLGGAYYGRREDWF